MLSFAPYQSHVGSPPRARGKDGGWGRRDRPPGDHPRVRGEKTLFMPNHAPYLWITPACAGKRGGVLDGEKA